MINAVGNAEIKNVKKPRIALLDELRGFAVICMVVYHALYTLGYIFEYTTAERLLRFFMPAEPYFAALFIYISGICTKLSRSNLKRGAILFFIALGINLFTAIFMPSYVIAFGILNLLSVCMIFYGLFGEVLGKLNSAIGAALSIACYAFTWGVSKGFLGFFSIPLINLPDAIYNVKILYPFGFKNAAFYSSDYFPILPWFFVFSAGAFSAEFLSKFTLPQGIYKGRVPFLSTVGRYSLIIYILHQPIIFIIAYIIKFIK